MKNLPFVKLIASALGLALLIPFLTGCSTSTNVISTDEPEMRQSYKGAERSMNSISRDEAKPNVSMVDMLRQVPGLDVRGSHPNASILIRGPKTVHGSNEPLFVVNQTVVGQGYSSISQSIDPQEVETIRVLKGPQAALYGARGGNGVIMIYTRE